MLFHIATTADWTPGKGFYTPASLRNDGFVHCATPDQVARVANERFTGRDDLLLLTLDPGRIRAPIRYENLHGGPEMFPHVYGPIEIPAVVSAVPLVPGKDGTFQLSHATE